MPASERQRRPAAKGAPELSLSGGQLGHHPFQVMLWRM
jgi:hypothetical protein